MMTSIECLRRRIPDLSARLFPASGPLERLPPAGLELFALGGFHGMCETTVHLPLRRDLFLVLPVTDGQSREIRRAQRRRLLEGPKTDRGEIRRAHV